MKITSHAKTPEEIFGKRIAPKATMPVKFTAVEETDDGLRFTMDIELDSHDRPQCTKLSVEPISKGVRIGSTHFRTHSVSELIEGAIALAVRPMSVEEVGDGIFHVSPAAGLSPEEAEEIWSKVRPPTSGSPLEKSHLEAIADIYRLARSKNLQPAAVIMKETGAPQSTVYRWIKAAKETGAINPE